MLDGLDKIDWTNLRHAYGPASDVPSLIRDLAVRENRESALYDLYGNIWHQGTVYEATGHAVPFLIEVLDAPEADVQAVLGLLSEIANGNSYSACHDHMRNKPDFRERLTQEQDWVGQAVNAVRAGLPKYQELLRSVDSSKRSAAAHLVATLGIVSHEIDEILLNALSQEKDELTICGFLLSIGLLPRLSLQVWDTVSRQHQAGATTSIRLAASLALARHADDECPEEILQQLQEASPDLDEFEGLSWDYEGEYLEVMEKADKD